MTAQFTDDQLVARYIELRNFLKDEAERQAEYVKPYADGMAAIQNELHARLHASGNQNRKTEHGTFFFKTVNSVKVIDRAAFLKFVLDNGLTDFLTSHVAKEPVEEYIEKHRSPPPGVNVEQITQVQVRAS